ncbi:amidohydrolase family protein [Tautonia plasticadhaerens]|uniref:Amidohydrolase n=1 Tax=Tautonia plasticadhaerens TaxID=2527974 RepID=A0A518HAK2_9BACT|nr:amidohydrolase family protein [Tautonia plasticadhaerens]QDV37873.1 Amidohydrolase [Tautonia plasticadhaerens]
MIVDVNAHLGPFAFRRLRHQSAESLLGLMDSRGIDVAFVSSAAAITHRNTQPANEDLADEARPHPDRLVPFAVINPSYAGWEDDLSACVDLGFRGLRLYPNWHAYELTSGPCLDLVDRATERRMILSLPIRVEDPRQQSWLVDVPDVPLDRVAALVAARPGARFHLVNGRGYVGSPLGRKDGGLPDNYRIDLARLDVLLRDEVETLLDSLGPDRLLFGTGIPFQYPDPTLAKIDVLDPPPEVRERILSRNAMEWLDGP